MNLLSNLLKKWAVIEPREIRGTLISFVVIFTLMASSSILKPVRDSLASGWSDAETSQLFTLTFAASAVAVMLYGWLCARIDKKKLVPVVYSVFGGGFFCFHVAIQVIGKTPLIDKSFYVLVGVFTLFNVSVFWSLMADVFSSEQAKRLFGFIASGASLGAIVGPLVTVVLVRLVGVDHLLIIPSVLLCLPWILLSFLGRSKDGDFTIKGKNQVIGGNPFAGFLLLFKSSYMLLISLFMFLYTFINTLIYFELKNLMVGVDAAHRVQILSGVELAVNILALATAMFGTSRLTKRFGLATTLGMVPAVVALGMVMLSIGPFLWVALILQVIARAGNYAITRPAREMLFTAVDQETRYKAKSVIDILVYRGGDSVSAWAFTGLTHGLGLTLGPIALIVACLAAIWMVVGHCLGRYYSRTEEGSRQLALDPVT
ncbi:MAG: transporter [Akkermansiaceae bacterium]|nr:transporter [Akkermansiaceae bacterium]